MKRWLKKWLPAPETIKKDRSTRWLGSWLNKHPYLIAINRRTVSRGVAFGLLVAFIPLPLQIFLAAMLAYLFRANLPIAIASTLISNPFTFIPFTYGIYKVGSLITHSNGMNAMPPIEPFHLHWDNISRFFPELLAWVSTLGESYLVGLLVVSVSASILGYLLVNIMWRIHVCLHLRRRKKSRSQK